jgi:parvulin-like peptidyl-prolyl isomerase
MVAGFGDTSFSLAVGGMGMCAYDNARSPFGWHIIKRIE